MNDSSKRYQKIFNNINLNMILKGDMIWIKISPIRRNYFSTILFFILNDESYNYEIYDKNGFEANEFYFEGKNCNPCFFLIINDKNYRISFNNKGIKLEKIKIIENNDDYIKKNCNNNSLKCSCWGKAVYHTSRPDKAPFNEM
jgi:hypothetical protein